MRTRPTGTRLAFALVSIGATAPAAAQITRNGAAAAPIATSVRVPAGATSLYVSGMLADPLDPAKPEGDHGDTEAQARSVFRKLAAELARNGMAPSDVVMMRVYLAAPPGAAAMDFSGMMRAYKEAYGSPTQPAKPARVTVQVAGLAAPWSLVEVEVQAAKVGATK